MNTRRLLLAATASIALLYTAQGAAQDPVTQARTLYASADYEQALKLLEGAPAGREASYYRALCLIALGRAEAADKQIAEVVTIDPMFAPPEGDVSPRVLSTFNETRRRLLPQIARTTFNEARRLFQAGDKDAARTQFELTLKMLDDASLDEGSDLADLRLVASGFIDLARSEEPPAPAPAPPPAQTAEAAPAPAPTRPAAVATLPVTIDQTLPAWHPDASTARRDYEGAVRVEIDETGRVTAAHMEKSVHVSYDGLVLAAAQRWTYKPATLNGVPVASEKTVEIQLKASTQR